MVLIHVYIVAVLNTHFEILKQIVTCHLELKDTDTDISCAFAK